MKKFSKNFLAFVATIATIFLVGSTIISNNMPTVYNASECCEIKLSDSFPLSIKPINPPPPKYSNKSIIRPPKYKANLTLLNIIPIKSVEINIVDEIKVMPCGTPFGVKIFTEGAMVIETSNVKSEYGICNPSKISGIKKGDTITKINDVEIKSNEDLAYQIEHSGGSPLDVTLNRNKSEIHTKITPIKSMDDQNYKIGVWVRDSSAGIGTITFYDKNQKTFSGLGHGICDVDTEELLPLSYGDIVSAKINNVCKGVRGIPGQLKGCFTDFKPIGELKANTETGVYGYLNIPPCSNQEISLSMKQNVKTGPAKILCTVSSEGAKYYNINIDSINYNEKNPTKNLLISIKDENLISKTGGIVQGMSGSPIIQNNTLVGAITHVFINDPKKGYGIFAETMVKDCDKIFGSIYKNVS